MSEMATHGAHEHPPGFAHQFEDMAQQKEASTLGMWAFLVTEILFFGGMFTAYTIYRELHFESFVTGSHLLEVKFGATNTYVLICSSLTMALAIRSAQTGKRKGQIILWLILTMIFGALFRASSSGLNGIATMLTGSFRESAGPTTVHMPRAFRCSCASISS